MRSLSPIIGLLLLAVNLVAQSPHGADLKMDCAACHNSKGWEIPASHWDFDAMSTPKSSKMTGMSLGIDTFHFNHNRTQFSLLGQHAAIDCRACHASLDFSEAQTDCISCHTDMHQQTLGTDCIRCHNSESWLVGNMADLHQENGFALVGAHVTASCYDCHTSASSLTFNRIGNDCINCHFDEFSATTNPNHQNAGFSTNCIECHDINRFDWVTDNFNHDFFPLTKAHEIEDCAKCHTSGNYSNTSPECVSCHQMDFDASINPNHHNANIETNCILCHTTDPGWVPATFANHNDHYPLNGAHALIATDCATCHNGDYNNTPNTCFGCHAENFDQTTNPNHTTAQFPTDCIQCHTEDTWTPTSFDHDGQYFPIFSGAHQGEWDQCIDCHTNPATFKEVSCTTCHVNPQTDNDHNGVGGYAYNSDACLACHPSGSADEVFDHNATHFPLTGAHTTVACIECHANGYQGTPTDCASCHTLDFNQTANPNHTSLGFSTDCASCHTTDPDWMPATFANHNEHYVLNGAHATIANDCVACHNGDYNNTPNTCFGCHATDYTQTNNPNHTSAHFPTDCTQCHSEDTWTPTSFDHDGQYFPIYSGAHNGEWDQCIDCHTNPANFAEVSCTTCHANPQTDNDHNGVGGYTYNSDACLACHPNGSANDNFDHNATNFPLTGAHTTVACIECHANGYQGTPTDCASCHTQDFNQTANPNHTSLGFSTDCASCHSTDPDWMPATFANHNEHYVLNGAHATIANDCVACHNGDYNNTPNTCFGCHTTDYTQTNNPNHTSAHFPTDCTQCHSEDTWTPASFDHDGQYFPIYSGAHNGEWDQCIDCHTNPANFAEVSCTTCHANPQTDNHHNGIGGYAYNSQACLACHPNGSANDNFDHNATNFPLTGAHTTVACIECHANGYQGTPTDCASCHTLDFNQAANPNHASLGFSTDCASCHTTDPDWMPATFANHNQHYVLNGAHATIANDCVACHNGDYNNTPNTCFGCHATDYTQTNNPNHASASFPKDCAQCHSENAWEPANFDHDGQYFPIYRGKHKGEWDQCIECHTSPSDYSIFSCIDCHKHNNETKVRNDHSDVGGFEYSSTACLDCHPSGN